MIKLISKMGSVAKFNSFIYNRIPKFQFPYFQVGKQKFDCLK